MKKKTLAAASLLLALLMPLGATPLAVYAEGDGTTQSETAPTAWDVSCSKKATDLDENYTSDVTLALPSEEEELSTDVVFVLDGSSSTETDVVNESLSLLKDLNDAVADSGAAVNVCVVKFKRQAFKSDWYNLSTDSDAIKTAMETKYKGGSNIHAGLLAGKEALSEHTNIPASRKYLILISDGSTYLYCKDGNWASGTPYTRSYYPLEEYNGAAGGFNDQGYYEPNAYACNVSRPQKTSDVAAWQAYFNDVEARNNESNGDAYDYHSNYDADKDEWALSGDFKTQPCVERSANNRDMAYYYANQTWQEIKKAGYNAYSIATKDGSAGAGNSDDSHSFMNYLNGGNSPKFSDIKKKIIYAVDADSYVEDVIGDKFTLDVDSLSIRVGKDELTKQAAANADNTWAFGDTTKSDRFTVAYNADTKTLTWNINEPITKFARVRLSYKVKLSNPETIPNSYSAFTNKQAILHPKDSAGATGQDVPFPKPEVFYTIYALNYDANGGNGAPAGEVNCTGKFRVSDTVPTRDGYVFAGWNTAPDGSGANCAAGSGIEGRKDSPALTLYAQWNKLVTVSFDLCGHGGANISNQTFVSGNKASEPTAPKEDGWVFGGWYTEKGCKYRFSFDSAVTSDIILYAKWDRVTTVASAPVATPTPSPAAAATKTATVKNAAIPQTSDAFPMEGLLALLAVGAVGFGAAGWLRKKHH